MKRFVLLFLSILFLLFVVDIFVKNNYPVTEPTNASTELVSALIPEKCDLGYVESKSIHDFTFELTNASDENWHVDDVKIECDCIAILDSPKMIPAKSQASIKLRFTAPKVVGSYTKTVTIAAGQNIWKSQLHARIDSPLRIEPKDLAFSDGITEQPFTIFNDGTTPVRLLYATSIPAVCNVKIGIEPVEPNSKTSLVVTLDDPTPDRLISLNIHTNHPQQNKITIPIRVK